MLLDEGKSGPIYLEPTNWRHDIGLGCDGSSDDNMSSEIGIKLVSAKIISMEHCGDTRNRICAWRDGGNAEGVFEFITGCGGALQGGQIGRQCGSAPRSQAGQKVAC